MSEGWQHELASIFGAPFFALSRLAPEVLENPASRILLISGGSILGADAGRWLSLYARLHRAAGTISMSVCVPSKPQTLKPPRPLLFQPVQPVVVKDWARHLDSLESPPDALLYSPESFTDLELAAQQFPSKAAVPTLLVACGTRLDTVIAKRLLDAYGYTTGEIISFGRNADEPQHYRGGAWWFKAAVPVPDAMLSPDPAVVDGLRDVQAYQEGCLRKEVPEVGREYLAEVFGRRIEITVEGERVVGLCLSSIAGIEVATGRGFGRTSVNDADGFVWAHGLSPSDLFGPVPEADPAADEDEDRLAVAMWVIKTLVARASRETTEPCATEGKAAAALGADEQADEEVSAAPATGQPAALERSGQDPVPSGARQTIPRPRLSRSAGTVNVLALAARLGKIGSEPAGSFEGARGKLLAWLRNKGFGELDPASSQHRDHPDGEVTIETDGAVVWSMRFDDRRSMESGAIWRVEATVLGEPSPAISLRLLQVRSTEEAPPPMASGVPQVVAAIANEVGLQDAGVPLRNVALRFQGEADGPKLSSLLLNPHRAQPVIVIAGTIDASADRLAKRLVGVAHVAVIDNAVSNHLIRMFGRDLSVYGSAVRLYRPGFGTDADQYQHRVWPRKGAMLSKWLSNDVFEEACAISIDAEDLDDRAPPFQAVRSHLAAARLTRSEQRLEALRERAESEATSKDEQIGELQAIRAELSAAVADYKSKIREMEGQWKGLQAELQAVRVERDSAREEVRQLRFKINNQWVQEIAQDDEAIDESYYPDTWDDLEAWVELYGEGRLVLHPKAAKAARASPFKDIPLAYKAMEYLVRHYIPMRTRSEDDTEAYQNSLQALAELGLEESDVGTADEIKRYKKEYERLYDGATVTLDRHLKRGVGFGGEYQFRLYFYYDQEQAKVLIGHLPTHLTNRLSHNG